MYYVLKQHSVFIVPRNSCSVTISLQQTSVFCCRKQRNTEGCCNELITEQLFRGTIKMLFWFSTCTMFSNNTAFLLCLETAAPLLFHCSKLQYSVAGNSGILKFAAMN